MRVRAGESPAEVAASIGTSVERVMRFAGPVMDERSRIAGESRRARARRSNRDGADSAVVQFGEAVDARFAAHGITATDVSWDARRREDGEWLVTAEWMGGEGTHSAEWLFHRGTRTVTPIDETAGDLLSDRPIRPVMPPEPTRPTLVAAPPLVPGIVAFPPMPDAHTGPIPPVDDVFDQEAPPEGPREVPPLVSAEPTLAFDEPPLPLGIAGPAAHPSVLDRLNNRNAAKRDESDDERAARARVPSWDDILLGVRAPTPRTDPAPPLAARHQLGHFQGKVVARVGLSRTVGCRERRRPARTTGNRRHRLAAVALGPAAPPLRDRSADHRHRGDAGPVARPLDRHRQGRRRPDPAPRRLRPVGAQRARARLRHR